MISFIAKSIERKADVSLADGQEMYRKYFVYTSIYLRYKGDVDARLTDDGYADVIVNE